MGESSIVVSIMTQQTSRFRLTRVALTWVRDSLRYRGFLATIGIFSSRIFDYLRDLTPSRRQLRYGDLQFDFDHGVDTTWSNISRRTRLREIFSGEEYQPIDPDQFHEMISALAIRHEEFTFIDLGSGKGRALLLASEYPFRRIIGVEIIPELHQLAQENFARYASNTQKCRNLQSWCGDARDFVFPADPQLIYLFNPFFEPVLADVLDNLESSLTAHPRELVLIYANPLSEHIVSSRAFLRKTGGTHQYSIYRSNITGQEH